MIRFVKCRESENPERIRYRKVVSSAYRRKTKYTEAGKSLKESMMIYMKFKEVCPEEFRDDTIRRGLKRKRIRKREKRNRVCKRERKKERELDIYQYIKLTVQ